MAVATSQASRNDFMAADGRDRIERSLSHPPARRKVTGRDFYKSIGSPRMILAPMVDRSEFAWRMLARSYTRPEPSVPLLAYTPMLHARLFNETSKFREQHFQPTRVDQSSCHNQTSTKPTLAYLDGNPSIDRPLFVQFCANDPDELLEAARHVEPFCDAIDLNLGCPQGIAKKGNYGAFLQEDWDLIYQLINKLHKELSIPVTAKLRILDTKEKTLQYAKMILSAGASIITVHGRRREQKGHNMGLADWSVIRYLREKLPPETVIFANGNILNHHDLETCLAAIGADGVMSAEGNLSDPTVFLDPPPVGLEGRQYWRGKDGKGGYRMDAVFRRYMDIIYKYVLEAPTPQRKPLFLPTDPPENVADEEPKSPEAGEDQPPRKRQKRGKESRSVSPNLLPMQGHLFHLLRPLVIKHINVRDALAKTRAGDMSGFETVLSLVEEAVKEGLQEYENHPERFEEKPGSPKASENQEQLHSEDSSIATVAKYKRPWWVCQPYVRPLPKEAFENGAMTLSKKEKAKLEAEKIIAEEARAPSARVEDIPFGTGGETIIQVPREGLVCG